MADEDTTGATDLDSLNRKLEGLLNRRDVDGFFTELVNNGPLLLKLVRRYSQHSFTREQEWDVVGEVLTQLVTIVRDADFRPNEPLRIVFTLLHRRSVDALRRHKVRQAVRLTGQLVKALEARQAMDPLEWEGIKQDLGTAVNELPDPQRSIVVALLSHPDYITGRPDYRRLAELVGADANDPRQLAMVKMRYREAQRFLKAFSDRYLSG